VRNPWSAGYAIRCADRYNVYVHERLSGQELVSRVNRAFTTVMTVSQGIGAVTVFVYLTVVLPAKDPPPFDELVLWNWPAGIAYIVGAAIVAPRWGRALARPRLQWLVEEREPTPAEQRRVLRNPLVQIKVVAVLWALAAVLFGLINLHFSTEIASRAAIGIVMGGLATSAISYLLGERALRPVTARALESGVPERPVVPGVVARTVLAWALATGIPLVGIAWVAGGVIIGDTPRSNATAWSLIFLAVVALVGGALAIVAAAKSIAEPIRAVRGALARVQEGDIDVEVAVDDASEVGLLQAGFNRMAAGLRERERLRDLFGRHVGEDVARQALEAGVELGGEVREAAVVFVDVVGSTALATEIPAEDVVRRLNGFFELVLEVVHRHGGWVNKFEGDAALCVFGVPTATPDPAGRALAAARELAQRIEADSPLVAAVGVSAGEVVAGNIGAARRFEYTVIGDAVNEAARLTELAKERMPRVLAAGRAVARAGEEAERWALGVEVTLRGRAEPTRLAVPVESAVPAG
jgi:adenylate cyclase